MGGGGARGAMGEGREEPRVDGDTSRGGGGRGAGAPTGPGRREAGRYVGLGRGVSPAEGAAQGSSGRGRPSLPFERLAAEAAAGRWRPVYLLAGPDGFQQRAVVDALRAAFVPEGLREAVETDLDGPALQPADVVGVALTPSFVGRRLVIVHDAPWFAAPRGRAGRADADGEGEGEGEAGAGAGTGGEGEGAGGPGGDGGDSAAAAAAAAPEAAVAPGRRGKAARTAKTDPLDPLIAYLDNPPPDTVVVFRSQQAADSRRRVVKRLGQVGAVLSAVAPASDDLPPWCVARAPTHGVRVQPAAAAALCMRVPASFDLLDQELAKLAAYVGAGGTIAADDVRALVAPSREESVFALMDAVAEGRAADAFALLRQMLLQGEQPLGIMALLARQVRLLAFGRDVLDTGGGPDRLAAAAGGLHPYVARRMLTQARAFAEPDLEGALEAVWEAEWAVKSGRLDEEAALLDTVARLLTARGRTAR